MNAEQKQLSKDNIVQANPTKDFFVYMLTRDIELEDAILELLDNCVDSIVRQIGKIDGEKPYAGYQAEITFNNKQFCIEDNCGGIPLDVAKNYAFMMGGTLSENANTNRGLLGAYGIGMKRAIFKIGQTATVVSKHGDTGFQVNINDKWLKKRNWDLRLTVSNEVMSHSGTKITVSNLSSKAKTACYMGEQGGFPRLCDKISRHFAYIIAKGFRIIVNKREIKPKPILFQWVNQATGRKKQG